MKRRKSKLPYLNDIAKIGVTNIVGVGMIGATSEMVNTLPASKTIAGVVPGLQSTALVGYNLKPFLRKKKSIW